MRKIITYTMLFSLLCISIVACGTSDEQQSDSSDTTIENDTSFDENVEEESEYIIYTVQEDTEITEEVMSDVDEQEESSTTNDVLVVYFSATGTTKGVAETIATVTDADLYEITPTEIYTSDDLNYNDNSSRTTLEQNDKSVRPSIDGTISNWDSYSVVYLGYPIWWGEEPRILDTFVDSYNFDGKTVIPFCTSGGSGVGSSDDNLAANAGTGTWISGTRLLSGASKSDIESWISNSTSE